MRLITAFQQCVFLSRFLEINTKGAEKDADLLLAAASKHPDGARARLIGPDSAGGVAH